MRVTRLIGLLFGAACIYSVTLAFGAVESPSLIQVDSPPQAHRSDVYGAEANPTGSPIGGGVGYRHFVTSVTETVATMGSLRAALDRADSGDVIYVADDASIDLTRQKPLKLKSGVTLASGRGNGGSLGAHLFSRHLDTKPLIEVVGHNARVTGLRIQGPDSLRRTEQIRGKSKSERYRGLPNSVGIRTRVRVEVDNCELWGWTHAAIQLLGGSSISHIHHNYLHHNQRAGLGYGVALDRCSALVQGNLFDWNRHSIAGTGRQGTSYEARYNLVLKNANSHAFDMHGGRDRKDGTHDAGDSIVIHHNTFQTTLPAVVLRGVPRAGAMVFCNVFMQGSSESMVVQRYASGGMRAWDNRFAVERIGGK